MQTVQTPVFKKSLLSWAITGNLRLQILLVLVISVTVFARVLPLEMQKRIVNEAIKLQRMDLLTLYCGIYFGAVLSATGLKFLMNVFQNIISERANAAMRQELYEHILTLPLGFFRKTQPGTVVSFLLTELNTAANFAGMAFAVPIINILTLLAFAAYLFWLNPMLAAISLSIYPIILFVLPLLQRGTNRFNKKRVEASRRMSDTIAESITGIHEIHGNVTFEMENRKFRELVLRLKGIRVVWNNFRNGIKVLNNFFTSLGPLLVFILGGYLTMKGQLELGALVAFLSAQEKLYDPWKELILYYQVHQDATVQYRRTMGFFARVPDHRLKSDNPEFRPGKGAIDVNNLSFRTEDGIPILSNVTFSVAPGEILAVVGFSGSGKSTLVHCMAQLQRYTDGQVLIDGSEVANLAKEEIRQYIGFVSQSPFIFSGPLLDNLKYACRVEEDAPGGHPSLDRMIQVIQQTGLFIDVLRFGLNTVLDPQVHSDLLPRIVQIRKRFREDFGDVLSAHVEFYNPDVYLRYASIGENLIFGAAQSRTFRAEHLMDSPYFNAFLKDADLIRPLQTLGAELARQTVDILGDLQPEAVFFQQSPIPAERLQDYKALVERLKSTRLYQLTEVEQKQLLTLSLDFIPGVHKLAALPPMLERLILESRALLKERLTRDAPDAVAPFRMDSYIPNQSLLNNILFGRMKNQGQQALAKVSQSITHLLIQEDLLEKVLAIGMQYEVGSKGENLSGGQRQKLAIARVLLKAPPILVLDEATSALDNQSQTRIQNLINRQLRGHSTVIAVVHRLDIVKDYDRIAVMKAGKLVEIGTYDALIAQKGALYELVYGKP